MPETRDTKKAPLIAGGAGLLLPQIGAIGKGKINPAGSGPSFSSKSEMLRNIKRGDILLSGVSIRGAEKPLKEWTTGTFVQMGMGSPKGYHAAVVKRVLPYGVEVIHNNLDGMETTVLRRDDHYTIYRPKDRKLIGTYLPTMRKYLSSQKKLGKELASRGLTEVQIQKVNRAVYALGDIGRTAVRELFVPYLGGKAPSPVDTGRKTMAKLHEFDGNISQVAENIVKRVRSGKRIRSKDVGCLAGVCTTILGRSGIPLGAGSNPMVASPADILRAKELRVVGSYSPKAPKLMRLYDVAAKFGPHITRGLAGIALGALASKGVQYFSRGKK